MRVHVDTFSALPGKKLVLTGWIATEEPCVFQLHSPDLTLDITDDIRRYFAVVKDGETSLAVASNNRTDFLYCADNPFVEDNSTIEFQVALDFGFVIFSKKCDIADGQDLAKLFSRLNFSARYDILSWFNSIDYFTVIRNDLAEFGLQIFEWVQELPVFSGGIGNGCSVGIDYALNDGNGHILIEGWLLPSSNRSTPSIQLQAYGLSNANATGELNLVKRPDLASDLNHLASNPGFLFVIRGVADNTLPNSVVVRINANETERFFRVDCPISNYDAVGDKFWERCCEIYEQSPTGIHRILDFIRRTDIDCKVESVKSSVFNISKNLSSVIIDCSASNKSAINQIRVEVSRWDWFTGDIYLLALGDNDIRSNLLWYVGGKVKKTNTISNLNEIVTKFEAGDLILLMSATTSFESPMVYDFKESLNTLNKYLNINCLSIVPPRYIYSAAKLETQQESAYLVSSWETNAKLKADYIRVMNGGSVVPVILRGTALANLVKVQWPNPILSLSIREFLDQCGELGVNNHIADDVVCIYYNSKNWFKEFDKIERLLLRLPNTK